MAVKLVSNLASDLASKEFLKVRRIGFLLVLVVLIYLQLKYLKYYDRR